jgi:hypothetical protein
MEKCKARPSVIQSGWLPAFSTLVEGLNPTPVLGD